MEVLIGSSISLCIVIIDDEKGLRYRNRESILSNIYNRRIRK